MKNTLRALVFHVIVIAFVFLLGLVLNWSGFIRELVYSNLFFKILLSFLPIMFYYNLGKGMSKRTPKKLDYFTGSLIFLIAIALGLVAFLGLGREIFSTSVASSMWRFPLDIFLMPQMYIYEVLKIKHNIITFIIAAIMPGIIFGVSIKSSRKKIEKQKRIRKMQERRKQRAQNY